MIKIKDIMTSSVMTLAPEQSLKDAHDMSQSRGVRHIPVVDPTDNSLLAVVTQKSMISKVFSLLGLYGMEKLSEYEIETNIMDVAVVDFDTVDANQSVAEVAPFFLLNRHGCLPVVDSSNQLLGIVTSSDFVKLTVKLLAQD